MIRIRELRQKLGWKQADLAEALNISRSAIGNYETEYRSLDVETIFKLCDIFGCTADYLLGRSELPRFDLTSDEAELLLGYRALSEPGREYLRHTLALAALGHSEKNRVVSDLETTPD